MYTHLLGNNHANGLSKGRRTRSARYNRQIAAMTDDEMRDAYRRWVKGEEPQNMDWETILLTHMGNRELFDDDEEGAE